jgi:hypothetical protein
MMTYELLPFLPIVRLLVIAGITFQSPVTQTTSPAGEDKCWTAHGPSFSAGSRKAVIEKATAFLLQTEKLSDHPYWPTGKSGITLGVGWDLGYHSANEMRRTWAELGPTSLEYLEKASGLKGRVAKDLLPQLRTIEIPKSLSLKVFQDSLEHNYYPFVLKEFPGIEKLPTDVQVAFISVIFNRGPLMGRDPDWRTAKEVDRRWEMRRMRVDVKDQDMFGIYAHLGSMKRLWDAAGPRGLLVRRRDEQHLIRPYVNSQLAWEQKQQSLKDGGRPRCPE